MLSASLAFSSEQLEGDSIVQTVNHELYEFRDFGKLPPSDAVITYLSLRLVVWVRACLVDTLISCDRDRRAKFIPSLFIPRHHQVIKIDYDENRTIAGVSLFNAHGGSGETTTAVRLNSFDDKRIQTTFYAPSPFTEHMADCDRFLHARAEVEQALAALCLQGRVVRRKGWVCICMEAAKWLGEYGIRRTNTCGISVEGRCRTINLNRRILIYLGFLHAEHRQWQSQKHKGVLRGQTRPENPSQLSRTQGSIPQSSKRGKYQRIVQVAPEIGVLLETVNYKVEGQQYVRA